MSHHQDAGRIPSLDGLRALAIGLVLVAHLCGTQGFPFGGHPFQLGDLGVRVFFVISGFLITTLLMNEERRYGGISLRHFYFRRTLRIFPAFYAYLLVMIALATLHVINLRPGDVLHAVTYTVNYHHDRAWELGHLWSLSVEEQFYLLWPLIVAWLGIRRAGYCAAAMLAVVPLARSAIWVFLPGHRTGIGETFITVTDSLAIGCVLAVARPWLESSSLYQAVMRSCATPAVAIVCWAVIGWFDDYVSFGLTIGQSMLNVSIAIFIDWSIRNSHRATGAFLNSPPLVRLGVLSYSLYLWQQLFIDRGGTHSFNHFPTNLALALALAALSYWLIESPLLKVRSQLERRWLPRRNARIGPSRTPAAASFAGD